MTSIVSRQSSPPSGIAGARSRQLDNERWKNILRVVAPITVMAAADAAMALRKPGSAMVMVPPFDIGVARHNDGYFSLSPAKVMMSPAMMVPVPADASVMVVAPTA